MAMTAVLAIIAIVVDGGAVVRVPVKQPFSTTAIKMESSHYLLLIAVVNGHFSILANKQHYYQLLLLLLITRSTISSNNSTTISNISNDSNIGNNIDVAADRTTEPRQWQLLQQQ